MCRLCSVLASSASMARRGNLGSLSLWERVRVRVARGPGPPCSATLTVLLVFLAIAHGRVYAASLDMIVCGSGGTEEYQQRFADWGHRLRRVLIEQLDHPDENVRLLTESREARDSSEPTTSLESIRSVVKEFAERISTVQDLYVYLIGHGSYIKSVSKFNIPGPDLTATELDDLIATVPARRVVVINATSSSAGFINDLSGPNRIICTATKSADEKNATEFMEYFIQGLEDSSADQNRDERISVLETCRQAAALTAAWYLSEGLLGTEHALLDDNGDALGSRLPIDDISPGEMDENDTSLDGALAAVSYIKDFSFPSTVPQNLIDRYLNTLHKVDELKRKKPAMATDQYYARLETLLIDAAKANRQIRRLAEEETVP